MTTTVSIDERSESLFALFRDGGLLVSARTIAQASRLGYVLLVGRTLGPDPYGVLAYLQSWGLLFLPFVNMGSQALLSRAFGRSPAEGRALAQRLWTLRLVVLPALATLLVVLGARSEPDTAIRPLFLIVGAALMGRGLAIWGNHVLVASRRADRVLVLEAGFRLAELAAAAVALREGVGVAGLLAIQAAGWWLQAGASALWVGATVVRPAWRWLESGGRELLREGLPVAAVGVALFGLLQGPVALGRHLLGTDATLGHLAVAMQLLTALVAIPNALGTASLPVLAGAGDPTTGRRYLRRVVPASAAGALALAAATHFAGEGVLGFLLGERFAAAAPLLTLGILVLVVPLAPAVLLSRVALASPDSRVLRRAAAAALAGLASGWVMTMVAAPRWGAEGVLLGAGTGALIWLTLLLVLHRRHDRTEP